MNDASSNERLEVKRFYDEIGWRRTEDKAFVDAARFEDLRPVSADYRSKCHLRVNRYLPHQGQYLLDVASGPIQFPEYLTYSEGYDYRLCADLSHTALQEARTTLGGRGLYVQCDITHLPFQADSIDTAISLHTIYHVSADNQIDAFRELHRVLRPGSRAVVVYSWSRHSLLMAITLPYKALVLMARYLKRLLPTRDQSQANAEPRLYFYVHNYRWFASHLHPLMPFDIVVWRSVNVQFLKAFIHARLFGKAILALIFYLEDKLPRALGRLGAYPMLLIQK